MFVTSGTFVLSKTHDSLMAAGSVITPKCTYLHRFLRYSTLDFNEKQKKQVIQNANKESAVNFKKTRKELDTTQPHEIPMKHNKQNACDTPPTSLTTRSNV